MLTGNKYLPNLSRYTCDPGFVFNRTNEKAINLTCQITREWFPQLDVCIGETNLRSFFKLLE